MLSSGKAPEASACARAMMLLQRAPTIPCLARSSMVDPARHAEIGARRFNSGYGVAKGSPNAAPTRPAIVVAAFTVTCWPMMARNPISNPLKAPGTRMPGLLSTSGAMSLSLHNCAAMISGRASRSNRLLTRARSVGRTGARPWLNCSTRASLLLSCVTLIQPLCSPPPSSLHPLR